MKERKALKSKEAIKWGILFFFNKIELIRKDMLEYVKF